jgi:hypothetical protein
VVRAERSNVRVAEGVPVTVIDRLAPKSVEMAAEELVIQLPGLENQAGLLGAMVTVEAAWRLSIYRLVESVGTESI